MPLLPCEVNEDIHVGDRNDFWAIEVMTATRIERRYDVEVYWQGSVAEGLLMGAAWVRNDG